jgi:hypothetical protein
MSAVRLTKCAAAFSTIRNCAGEGRLAAMTGRINTQSAFLLWAACDRRRSYTSSGFP